jgi:hypothetical protein
MEILRITYVNKTKDKDIGAFGMHNPDLKK